ncbi:discoidin domain-containing protein [Lysinibacillus sp. CNPSo 3705]|uniref:discoidin domain-containing protein n=1 Tax=Lysinibacillus sp. CNPSo 3705 TaxID=3028148 RepID=UPI00236323E4|nr:discoidin domain-containing protein [Lysinibacillus sp. CNPSo 3705]MDD1502594.1 discoidin domain-containing protein [Lysinibacillus sp. CNPSo 3705]
MATIGQALTSPESGWRRYDDTDDSFKYSGDWNTSVGAGMYNGSRKYSSIVGDKISFSFNGTKLRIIGVLVTNSNTNGSKTIKINIDGEPYVFSNINSSTSASSNVDQALLFEKSGLNFSNHVVVIELASNFFWFDAIDIDVNGEIFRPPNKKLLIRNNSTYYSLSENTLIHLSDNSIKNMILHGIEQGKEIQLDVPFDKHRYFNDTPVDGASGKVFTHDVGKINTLNIKEIRESKFVPTYNMIATSMTANNAPSPFVASVSSIHSDPYPAWRAFNGTVIDMADAWISSGSYVNGIGSEWIQIDYGESKFVNTLFLTHRAISTSSYSPKKIEILGSNDGKTFDVLHTDDSQIAWGVGERRIFTFNNTQAYRYYRLKILEIHGTQAGSYVQIGEIQFGYKGEVN